KTTQREGDLVVILLEEDVVFVHGVPLRIEGNLCESGTPYFCKSFLVPAIAGLGVTKWKSKHSPEHTILLSGNSCLLKWDELPSRSPLARNSPQSASTTVE